MHAGLFSISILADFLGGWEIVLILAVVLILFGAGNLPDLARPLSEGLDEFFRAGKSVGKELGQAIEPEQKQSGLVYEALTHDNRSAEFINPHRSDLSELLRAMILFIAQGFGVGRLPFAPGLFGSLVGLLWFAILLAPGIFWLYLAGTVLGLGCSVWLCGVAERILKQKDPPSVVLDEIIAIPVCFLVWVASHWSRQGQMPALESFFTARTWFLTVLIFVLFRILDVLKPWPIRPLQDLPGGWGITADDLLAALCVALITLFLVV